MSVNNNPVSLLKYQLGDFEDQLEAIETKIKSTEKATEDYGKAKLEMERRIRVFKGALEALDKYSKINKHYDGHFGDIVNV